LNINSWRYFFSFCFFLNAFSHAEVSEYPLIPSAEVRLIGGGTFRLEPAKITKPTLIVFWATWCSSCLREIPLLKKLHLEHGEKIDVISVSIDTDLNKVRNFVEKVDAKYTNLIDDNGRLAGFFGVKQTPALFVVDPQGHIQARGNRVASLISPLLSLVKERESMSVTRDTVLMGTDISFVVLSADEKKAHNAIDVALAEIKRIEDLMTDWRESELTSLNRSAAIVPVKVDPEIFFLIEEALKVSKLTQGAFDISYASVGALWDFSRRRSIPPQDADIKQALSRVDYRSIEIDSSKKTVFFKKPGMKIGLGGIAKGYAVDQVIKILERQGFKDFAIKAGGDLTVRGRNKGALWQVAIQSPRDKSKNFALIPLSNGAVATSGDSERFFMFENKRYGHIIDPRTGYPADKSQNVTIIGKNGYLVDALATGVFVLGPDEGMKLIESLEGYEGVIIDAQGKISVSPGLQKSRTVI